MAVWTLKGSQDEYNDQIFGLAHVQFGSKADLAALKFDFRYTSESRHHADMSAYPKSAK